MGRPPADPYDGRVTGQGPLAGVGATSLGVAMVRAHESQRPDRLFNDHLAAAFVAAAPNMFPEARAPQDGDQKSVGAAFGMHAVFRTRCYDDYLLAACETGVRQVVLVAAGLDTRAFRLPWPDGTHVFEADLPSVLSFKDEVLAAQHAMPSCVRTTVPVDLRADWPEALRAAGFDPTRPTAWLVEGLLVYLTAEEADRLLSDIDALSAQGSQVSFESSGAATADLLDKARITPSMRKYSRLWRGGLDVDPAEWLRDRGWDSTNRSLSDIAEQYGRPLTVAAVSGFLTAVRTAPR